MISAQIEEMRETANEASRVELTDRISTTWMRNKLAPMLRNAADTIGQLRDDLQRTNAVLMDVEHDESVAWDRVRKAEAENARLRELAEKAWKIAEMLCQAWDGPCRDDGTAIYKPCPLDERDELCVYGLIQRDLRELGVEVDG